MIHVFCFPTARNVTRTRLFIILHLNSQLCYCSNYLHIACEDALLGIRGHLQQLHTASGSIIRHLCRRHQNVKCTHFVRLPYHSTAFVLFSTYEWKTFLYLLSSIKRKTCVSMVTQYITRARGKYMWNPSAVIRRGWLIFVMV